MTRLVDQLCAERVLRNAYTTYKSIRLNRSGTLWVFVSETTGHGSTVSMQICEELGWNPFMQVGKPLPPWTAESLAKNRRIGSISN